MIDTRHRPRDFHLDRGRGSSFYLPLVSRNFSFGPFLVSLSLVLQGDVILGEKVGYLEKVEQSWLKYRGISGSIRGRFPPDSITGKYNYCCNEIGPLIDGRCCH